MTINTAVVYSGPVRPRDGTPRVNNELVIRPYVSSDQEECREIFTLGMEQLIGLVTQVVFPRYLRYSVILAVIAILAAVAWSSSWILPAVFVVVCVMALAAIYINVYLECWKFINHCLATDLWNIEKSYMTSRGSQMVVAEWKGKVVGMVGLIHNETHEKSEVELQRMSISTQCRRMGIARKLMDNLTQFAKKQKYDKIILSTTSAQTPALSLYKKYGFKLVKVLPYPQGILADLEYHCFELKL